MENHILIPTYFFKYKIKMLIKTNNGKKTYNGGLRHHKLFIEFKNKNINFIKNFKEPFTGMDIVIFPNLNIIPTIKGFYISNSIVHILLDTKLREKGLYYPTEGLTNKEIAKLKLLL